MGLNIGAKLSGLPHCHKAQAQTITRGASAVLNYFTAFDFEDIEQVSFLFDLGKSILQYDMIKYYVPSEDSEANPEKQYFTITILNPDSKECLAKQVTNPSGSPKQNIPRYYEQITLPEKADRQDYYWQLSEHFTYTKADEAYPLNTITCTLFSKDTLKFPQADLDNALGFEVAMRLDSDNVSIENSADSLIIEPQCPIVVLDSLFAKLN